MKKIWTLILVLLGFMTMAQTPTIVTGDEEGWYQIGKVSASFKSERESIVVMGKDEFETIKLRVEDAAINIERMQVFFEGGKTQDIDVAQPLQDGEETREFELEADNKEIDKVVFYYQTVNDGTGERASVELYGYKNEPEESVGIRDERNEAAEDINESKKAAQDEMTDEARETREDIDDAADRTEDQVEKEVNEAEAESRKELNREEERVEEAVEESGHEIKEESGNMRDEAREEWREDEEALEETGNEVEQRAEELREETREEYDQAEENVEGAAERTQDELERGADNVRDEVDEHGTKLKSEITDREVEDKAGPDGQEIYFDDRSNYYYVDERGDKVYVPEDELTDRGK